MKGMIIGNRDRYPTAAPKLSPTKGIAPPRNKKSVRRRSCSGIASSSAIRAEYWWRRIRGNELVDETRKWRINVAAEAHCLSPLPPEKETRRGVNSDESLIPKETDGSYGSIPLATRVVLFIVVVVTAVTIANLCQVHVDERPAVFFSIFVLIVLLYAASTMIVQELWYSPSQVSTTYLADKGLLPSAFSNIDTVEVEDDDGPYSLDVHYLHVKSSTACSEIDAIYCNHGFGAWSHIWLPVMRKLEKELQVSHVLSHDTVGFGLTSRPPVEHIRDLHRYGFSFSAGIGLALLERTLSFFGEKPLKQSSNVVLIGHSMGSLTTLRMALQLPESTEVQVILVAPAVFGPEPSSPRGEASAGQLLFESVSNLFESFYALCLPFIRLLRIFLIDPPSYFLLKRTIAFRPFWHILLWLCWGDKNVLTASDVERYRWPSIVDGCVEGVIHFLRAQPFCHGFLSYPGGDLQLLADVLERPNVRSVSIIQGTRDPLTPLANARRLARLFPKIHLEELTGMGHDPTAESPHRLMEAVHKVLAISL